jgi:hypothetical protein
LTFSNPELNLERKSKTKSWKRTTANWISEEIIEEEGKEEGANEGNIFKN